MVAIKVRRMWPKPSTINRHGSLKRSSCLLISGHNCCFPEPWPDETFGQTGLPMLERSSDPSQPTVNTKPVIEAKPSVDTPATAEKPLIEKTLSQEEEELKAASEAAKSTEDHQAVAEKGLTLADRAIVEGNADLAKTAVKKSLVAARKADDVALTKRATQLLMQLQNPLSESLKDAARKRRGEASIPAAVVPLKAMVKGLTERANDEYSYATAIAFTRRDSPHVIKGTLYPADGGSDGTITSDLAYWCKMGLLTCDDRASLSCRGALLNLPFYVRCVSFRTYPQA